MSDEESVLIPPHPVTAAGQRAEQAALSRTRTHESVLAAHPPAMTSLQKSCIIASLLVGVFLAAMDATIVTALLIHIASDLNDMDKISWIATGYLLSTAAFQPLYGKISDIFGRRALLLFCNSVFAIGCLLCAEAPSLAVLVAGRFVTGIGGGGLTALSTITMSDFVPLRQRGVFQGLGNLAFGCGAAIGGAVGGLISDIWGWRACFLFQVPIAVCSGGLIYVFLAHPTRISQDSSYGATETLEGPESSAESSKESQLSRVDFLGSFLLVAALLAFLFATATGGKEFAWLSWQIILLYLFSVVFGGAFVYTELYVAPEPVVPVYLLANRTILASSLTNWFMTMSVYTYLYFVPMYFEVILGLSDSQSGARLASNFVGVSSGSLVSGFYMKKTGRYRWFSVVTGLMALAGVVDILLMHPEMRVVRQYLLLLLPGFGYAAMLTVTLLALIAAVPQEFQAVTTSIQYAFRATGSTIGVSVSTAVYQLVLSRRLIRNLHKANAALPTGRRFGEKALSELAGKLVRNIDNVRKITGDPQFEGFRPYIISAFERGIKSALVFALVTNSLAFICVCFMKEYHLHSTLHRE